VFQCTTPAAPSTGETYACSGDIYCLNGDCTQVTREASPDFAQALTAIHAMGDASAQLDASNLQLFGGQAQGCHKPLFRLVNCCAGKSTGLIAAASGAAALAAGRLGAVCWARDPAPHPVPLRVGRKAARCERPYGSVPLCRGILLAKAALCLRFDPQNYCCYESKLARVIREQGRAQLGKAGHGQGALLRRV
jgi:conjugal transfer mating pair stabilization protein TraN